jgi:hypothetical protein
MLKPEENTMQFTSSGPRPSGRQKRNQLRPYMGCPCGRCPRCIDDAKWNERFEKFVDATYYTRDIVASMRSPLANVNV